MAFLEYRPTQTLFQYCPLSSFFGILQSKRLWFSDLTSANDPREIKLGHEKFIDALKSVRHNEYQGERGRFLSFLAARLATYDEEAQAFCSCFSLVNDQLPLWAAYGANYSGLAIGLRPTAVFAFPARVQKVKYVDQNTHDDFRRVVLEIAAELDSEHISDNQWINATVAAFAAMTSLKHESWSYEREVRIVHMQTRKRNETVFQTGEMPDGSPVHWTQPLERNSSIGKISYLEFPFGQYHKGAFEPRGAIEKIIIGPKCTATESEVNAALRSNGFDNFEVSRSVCAIR